MKKKMRKAAAIALVFTLLVLQYIGIDVDTAKAAQYGDLGILGEWEYSAPDYYCHLEYLSEKDAFLVYLKENTKENQKIILDGISDNMKIIFASCEYSRNELRQVMSEITTAEYPGVQSWGITSVTLDSGAVEPRVSVSILKDNYGGTAKKLAEKYGDKVYTVSVPTGDKIMPVPIVPNDKPYQPPVTPTVKFKSVKYAKKKITVKWKKMSTVSKYKIVITKTGGKTVLNKTTKKAGYIYKIKGKAAKRYTVKVKAYNKSAKKWGAWTKRVVKKK